MNEREQKIHNALFAGEQNEYSVKIETLDRMLSSIKPAVTLPEKISKNKIVLFPARRILAAAAVLLVAGIAITLLRQPHTPVAVTAIKGDVTFEKNGLSEKNAESISTGDSVITGKSSWADIAFPGGTSIRVNPGSRVTLEQFETGKDEKITVRINSGEMLAIIHKNKKSSGFSAITSFGRIEVRGTSFLVKSDTELVSVAVLEGRVALQKPDTSGEQVLEAMQEAEMSPLKFKRSNISDRNLAKFARLKDIKLEDTPRAKTSYKSEEELIRDHNRLEKIILSDGRIFNGVITDMDDTSMTIQTVNTEIIVPRELVTEVEQIR